MKRAFFRGQVREMALAAVQQLIPFTTLQAIRAHDPEPFFFELILAHEGQSTGTIRGLGHRVKEWAAKVIRSVAHAFNPAGRVPAKIYDGIVDYHGNEDNRVPVGEIIYSRVISGAQGRDEAQGIGYLYPTEATLRTAINQGERDICSLECDVEFREDGPRVIVEDVMRASAVVLGHSSRQMPGFSGAIVRPLAEFGPTEASASAGGTEASPAAAPSSGVGAAGTASTAGAEAGGYAAPAAGAVNNAPPPPNKAELVAAIKAAGITAADLGWTAPAHAPTQSVVAPPAQPTAPETPLDLTDPKVNPFLPE